MKRSDCEMVRERLSEYLDEALSGRETRRVAAHLATCEECRRTFDDLRVTKAVLGREAVPPPAPDFWTQVYAEVRRQSTSIPAPRRRVGAWWSALVRVWSMPKGLATGAAVVAVLLAAIFLRPLEPPALADDVDDFITQHAHHSAALPLNNWSRMTFIRSEVNALKAGE